MRSDLDGDCDCYAAQGDMGGEVDLIMREVGDGRPLSHHLRPMLELLGNGTSDGTADGDGPHRWF